jgi:hypothetical protein
MSQPSVYNNVTLRLDVFQHLAAADSFYGSDVFDMTIGHLQSIYGTVAFPSCLASWVKSDVEGYGDVTQIELSEVKDWLSSSFSGQHLVDEMGRDMLPYVGLLRRALQF